MAVQVEHMLPPKLYQYDIFTYRGSSEQSLNENASQRPKKENARFREVVNRYFRVRNEMPKSRWVQQRNLITTAMRLQKVE